MNKINLRYNKELVSASIEELKKNPSVSKYDIDVFNFNNFSLVAKEACNCKKCNGIKDCLNDIRGYYHICNSTEKPYTFSVKACKYKEALDIEENSNSLIKTKYVSKGILESRLDDFYLTTANRKNIYNYVCKFLTEFKRNNFMKGLYIHGAYGTGKTYLMAAVANELGKRGFETLLIYFPDLARELKGMTFSDRLEPLINELKSIDVLMIDDLGGELLSSWLRDDVVGPILNYRVSEGLPIFITSNLDLDEMYSHFEQTKDEAYNRSGDSFKAGRIMERIKNLTIYSEIGINKNNE